MTDLLTPSGRMISPRRIRDRLIGALTTSRPYLIVFLISSVVVSRWFVPGTFISTGDMGPWLRQGWEPEATSSWNHTISGAGSAAFTVARGFEFILIDAVRLVGGDEYVGQWLFYTLIYGLVAVGATFAARGLVRSEAAAIAAGTFAILNGFFLTRVPNPLNIISVGSIALLTGLALRVARGRSIGAPWAGIALLPTSFLAFNPPMLVVAYAWTLLGIPVLVGLMLGWRALGRLARWMLAAAPWALLLNLWWLVPLALSYTGGGGAVANADFTDPTAWAWSQAQNQVPNVLTLVANWAWVKPQYLPFAAGLDESWIVWARYLIPAVVFLAPVLAVRRLRRPAIVLVGFALVFVVLAKGLQPPFRGFNLFLYDNVPGFWLFREPMSKLGQLLVLLIALLIAIALDSVSERAKAMGTRAARAARAGIWVVVAIIVLQPYPLWTGAVIPDVRPNQPSAHVRVPQFWHDMADQLNADERPGKVLVLPLDDYYQMPTTWGFAGVDSIANLLIQHPVVQPKPDGYFGDSAGFSAITRGVETALVSGDLAAVPRLLVAGGISRVIVRHDLVRGMPGRTFADDRVLDAALTQVPGMTKVVSGELDLWHLGDGSISQVRTFGAVLDAPARPTAGSAAIASLPGTIAIEAPAKDTEEVPADAAVFTDDIVAWPVPAVDEGPATTTVPLAGGRYTVSQRARSAPALVPSVRTDKTGTSVVLTDPTELQIDGRVVSSRPELEIPVPTDKVVAVTAGTRTVFLDGWGRDRLPGASAAAPRPAYLPVGSATPVTVWSRSTRPAQVDAPSEVYDCNNYEPRPASELELRLERRSVAGGDVLRLSAVDHAACTRITVRDAAPGRTYRVQMEMRTLEGKRPEVCLWQQGTDGCDLVPRAPIDDEWTSFDELVTIEEVATGLQVVLYANVGVRHQLKTVTEYRNVRIEALDPVVQTTVFPPAVPEVTLDLPPGSHTLTIEGGQSGSVLGDFGPLENCYNTRQMTNEEAGLSATRLDGEAQPAFRLTAQYDRACIAAPVPDMGASSLYELSYEGRSVALRNPSVCLYQRGPDRCTKTPAGGPWLDWSPYSTFVGPDPRAVETRLYLFGSRDLAGNGRSVVEYRDVALRPVASPVDVVLTRHAPIAATATSEGTRINATRFRASFTGATPVDATGQGTYLALSEGFAPGWAAQASTGVDQKAHTRLQGWLNAWPATASDGQTDMVYRPDRMAQFALLLLPAGLLAAFAWLAVRRPVRRRVARGWAAVRRRLPRRARTEGST